jgi:hypothetical protein
MPHGTGPRLSRRRSLRVGRPTLAGTTESWRNAAESAIPPEPQSQGRQRCRLLGGRGWGSARWVTVSVSTRAMSVGRLGLGSPRRRLETRGRGWVVLLSGPPTGHAEMPRAAPRDRRSGRFEIPPASEASGEGDPATHIALNETQHMTETSGGARVARMARRNVGKSPTHIQARIIEYTNTHRPGQDSVAEQSYLAWQRQESPGFTGFTGHPLRLD